MDLSKISYRIDACTIVAMHLILPAVDEGVDSYWSNFLDQEKLLQALELFGSEEAMMVLDLGYTVEKVYLLPNHTSRKEIG